MRTWRVLLDNEKEFTIEAEKIFVDEVNVAQGDSEYFLTFKNAEETVAEFRYFTGYYLIN